MRRIGLSGTIRFLWKFYFCMLLTGAVPVLSPISAQDQPSGPQGKRPANNENRNIQPDSLNILIENQDTIPSVQINEKHSPQKAVLYSLICPGLGQIYNKKYWKLPFIYGGAGAFLYYVNYNQMKYKKFRTALFENQTSKEAVIIDGYLYEYDNLDNGRDYYRRYRDISIAGLAGMYLLNVIDAMVDAYFVRYDISDDLSLKLEPAVIQNTGLVGETASYGFRINIDF